MRRPRTLVLALFGLLAAAPAPPERPLVLGARRFLSDVPELLADSEGLYAREGAAVRVVLKPQGRDIEPLLRDGTLDAAVLGSHQGLAALAHSPADDPLAVLACLGGGAARWRVMASTGSGVTDLGGLAGRRLGVWPRSYGWRLLDRVLRERGIAVRPVTIPMDPLLAAAALEKGEADAVLAWEPVPSLLETRGAREVYSLDALGAEMPVYLVARASTARRERARLAALLRALGRAAAEIDADPEAAAGRAAARLGLPAPALALALKRQPFRVGLTCRERESIAEALAVLRDPGPSPAPAPAPVFDDEPLRLAARGAAGALAPPEEGCAAEARPVVRVGYFHGGRTNLIYRAHVFGAFDAAGLDVRLLSRDLRSDALYEIPKTLDRAKRRERDAGASRFGKLTGIQIADLMAKGEADAGLLGEGSFLYCLRRGDPLVAVAALGHDAKDKPGHVILLRKGLKIARPEDFKGLRLASRRAGPGDGVFLREFLRAEGVDPSWVKIIEDMDDDRVAEALEKGEIDGGYYHLIAARRLIVEGKAYAYRPLNWLNPEAAQALLVFRRDFLEKNPDAAARFVDAYVRRIREEHARPPQESGGEPDKGLSRSHVFEGMSLPVYDDEPYVRIDLLQEMEGRLIRYGELDGPVDLAAAVDRSFVARALAGLSAPAAPRR